MATELLRQNRTQPLAHTMHEPNRISFELQALYVFLTCALLTYAAMSVIDGVLYLPNQHGESTKLYGFPMRVMVCAILCACASMTCVVVDHYDTRDNERYYKEAAFITQVSAIALAVIATILSDFFGPGS